MFGAWEVLGASPRPGFKVPDPHELFEFKHCFVGSGALCVNRVALLMLLTTVVVLALFLWAFRAPKLVPSGLQNVLEAYVEFIRDQLAIEVIGPAGAIWTPYLATLFIFVFAASVIEVIPGVQFPVTSRMAVPIFLAVLSWVLFNAAGIRAKGVGAYFKEIVRPPGVPIAVLPLVAPIEFAATIIFRPFTLALRLWANLFAGHLLLTVFYLATAYLLQPQITALFASASLLMSIVLTGLEVFVAVLQAYVFTILTAVYIAGAVSAEH
jgi:F-type H+-transporting ATPase subunit a